MSRELELEEVVLIGRTFEEYDKMFELAELNLVEERVLDVASGVSSFGAEAREYGYDVISSDRIYQFSPAEIEKKCSKDLVEVMDKLEGIKELYKWDFFNSIDHLKKHREKAYKTFVKEFSQNKGDNYKFVEYPSSSFRDKEFSISLVSHFLFMYDEHLDYDFHKRTLEELIRITRKEIRIFPLVNLKGKKSDLVERIMEDEDFKEFSFKKQGVNYEFVKGGNEILKINLLEKE
ncbi:hypothetical protein SAMN05660297_02005 [Natronincola peptidivorans]|uniref:Methyltransferase domain-containing protein n=1 Tax=Natronincola peptidivorans TaxID=426128 RepID=A0A1I0DEV2_9FIRM|nr:hypothetical protein [Natronincola peptidivorans]SET30581.1 hypothetical protein SAMN05660297_02005 [Natronincola peptidivorans]